MTFSFLPTRANEWHPPAPVWLIPVRELYFSRKLLCLSSQVFCHVQRAPGLTADACSSFKTFLYHGFCILQIHHFCSLFCSPFCLAFWPPGRQKQEIFKSLPGSRLKNPYSAALPRSEIPPVLLRDTQHMHSGENYKEERWDYQSKSCQKLWKKSQNKNTSFFSNIALQVWEKPHFLIQDFASFEMSNWRNLHYSLTSPTIYWTPLVFTLTGK